jgi:hypothetical protein
MRAARVDVLGERLDGPALAGRVATLEEDDDPLARLLDPRLKGHELPLEASISAS